MSSRMTGIVKSASTASSFHRLQTTALRTLYLSNHGSSTLLLSSNPHLLHSCFPPISPVLPARATATRALTQVTLPLFQSSTTPTTTTTPTSSLLDAFRDPVSRAKRMAEPVGRSWSVRELRRKSYDDLHKLWLVLYKERNMLLTEQQLSRRKELQFPQPERIAKVRKSMGAIKHVLGERKRLAIARHQKRQQKQQEQLPADEPVVMEFDGKVE